MTKTEKSKQRNATSTAPIKLTKKGEIELSEGELSKISGGLTPAETKTNGIIAV